jgi:predicted site-specific integrase-resolvase
MKIPDGYVSVIDAAEIVGCSTQTIRNYYRAGKLTPYRVGLQKVILLKSEVERLASVVELDLPQKVKV